MTLHVLYDAGCALCERCRRYLEEQPSLVELHLVPLRSPRALELCGGRIPGHGVELVVVGEDGAYWIGPDAFVMCLWALESHRSLALMLARPSLRPLARFFFERVSSERHLLSRLVSGQRCEEGHCGVPSAQGAYR